MKILWTMLLSAAFCGLTGLYGAAAESWSGDGFAFFLPHGGGDLPVTVKAEQNKKGTPLRAWCRFIDTDDMTVERRMLRNGDGQSTFTFKKAPPGIYQVRISGENITVSVSGASGVMPMRSAISVGPKNPWNTFLIPERTAKVKFRPLYSDLILRSLDGKKEHRLVKNKFTEIDFSQSAGELWQVAAPRSCRLGVQGMPLILCDTPQSAKAIGGSVVKAADGTCFPHKFQVKIYEMMQKFSPEELAVKPYDPRQYRAGFAADPEAARLLGDWGLFSHISEILRRQNINRTHERYGDAPNDAAIAAVYAMNKPFNIFYRDSAIEKRMLLASCRFLLLLKESDTLEDSDQTYSGGDAIFWAPRFTAFAFGASALPDGMAKKLWTEAMLRPLDRFPFYRVSCENQSAHWAYILTCAHRATGIDAYRAIAADYVKEMLSPSANDFMKTGYLQEAFGPDATYQGLGTCYLALYYRMTGDANAKKGLDTIYRLFNHTVAREPSGRIFGSSSFSHRTTGSWVNKQYNGGVHLLAGELDSAAVWCNPDEKRKTAAEILAGNPHTEEFYRKTPQSLLYTTGVFTPFELYFHPVKNRSGAKLPHEESERFYRNFNNEFLAVRNPKYYALTYCGMTSEKWTAYRRPQKANNTQTKHGHKVYKWSETQGLSLVWLPGYGSLLTGMNWNGDTANFLRADLPDGRCAYPDYWTLQRRIDGNTIDMSQAMFQLPGATFRRRIVFAEDRINVKLEVRFVRDTPVTALYEQLPLLANKPVWQISFVCGDRELAVPSGAVREVKINNRISIVFSRPQICRTSDASEYRGQKIVPLRIFFGENNIFPANSVTTLEYEIIIR